MPAPAIFAALALDAIIGDPAWLPHPVMLIGNAIARGEKLIHAGHRDSDLIGGAMLTVAVIAGSAGLAWLAIGVAASINQNLGMVIAVLIASTTLALRGLGEAAAAVKIRLETADIVGAREVIPALVGRDPGSLGRDGLIRATLESVAENAGDGIIAPLTFLFLGGPAAAIAYKAINTLDSMIGHRDERYLYFGRVAARIDDAANFLPARIAGLCMVAASAVITRRSRAAWRALLQDAHKHASPNAGFPESAMAGALGLQLGGDAVYAGEREHHALLGCAERAPEVEDIDTARMLIRLTTAIAFIGLAGLRYALLRV